ncbi:MAG: 23S rRNA (uracil(1939)-C(5))-methyltransferase RlmD [Pseudomonas sp.]
MRTHRGRARPAAEGPAAVGQRIELSLERLSHDGRGIGRWQGRTTFVDGGLPGERVQARVTRARSKLVETRLENLLQTSDQRLQPACQHAHLCGGCSLQHMPESMQLEVKQQALAQQLQHFGAVTPENWMPPLHGPAYAYRQRTRLAMRWDPRAGRLQVGYRQRASSELVEISQCPVLVPELEQLIQELIPVLRSLDGRAGLGHAELTWGAPGVLLIRHMQPLSAEDRRILQALAERHAVGLWLDEGNGSVPCVDNAELPAYPLPDEGLRMTFAPGDFIQVNAAVNQAMVTQALDWLAVQPGEQVLDLFCGVGNFSLPLARRGAQVTGVEGSSEMVEMARTNALNNQLEGLHFFQADLSKSGEVDWLPSACSAALLDPPREGAEQLVQRLAASKVQRILYVSCNPSTLARDAGLLAAKGYRLVRVGIMDMFPQTAHVEAMALFEKGPRNKAV